MRAAETARRAGVARRTRHQRRPPPIEVHTGSRYAAGKRRRPMNRDEARQLLTSGVRACSHCPAPGRTQAGSPAELAAGHRRFLRTAWTRGGRKDEGGATFAVRGQRARTRGARPVRPEAGAAPRRRRSTRTLLAFYNSEGDSQVRGLSRLCEPGGPGRAGRAGRGAEGVGGAGNRFHGDLRRRQVPHPVPDGVPWVYACTQCGIQRRRDGAAA
ncbi:DUF6233 domain-containing protein [Streptomyces sp. BV286]|uniref:DUF6233 domain-containing protein n=1 Tax=Streptomyces sp. BV286 TaxID=2849672 RepID=UPI0020C606BA|nr:DUF6233 domain-containing protein [Streptomyces sp. BV286]